MSINENVFPNTDWVSATLDKRCWKVLKYLYRQHGCVKEKTLYVKFDERFRQTIIYLLKTGYIEMVSHDSKDPDQITMIGKEYVDAPPRIKGIVGFPGNFFRITPMAKGVVESRPRLQFEHWLTIAIAVWGAITGTLALLIDLLPYFLQG